MRLDVSVMFTDETIELFHITQLSGLGTAHIADRCIPAASWTSRCNDLAGSLLWFCTRPETRRRCSAR